MRTLFGVGTPRGLHDRAAALLATLWSLQWHPETDRHDDLDSILVLGVAN